jgi:hypothetical protein
MMQTFDVTTEYESRSDDDLLRLTLVHDQLTEESRAALFAELDQRGIRAETGLPALRKKEEALAAYCRKQPGAMFFIPHLGIGRKSFCKSHCVADPSTGTEEFDSTVFIVLFWLPLIPIGTWRMRRKAGLFPTRCEGVDRLPLDWHQVRIVWSVALATVAALVYGLQLLPSLLLRIKLL